mmetsp:Transcript_28140/g.63672  ORF Transcript_28140/g.63672 Transcript_28140/m.63672 type:complete len:90 (+) Transcript_28140:480-749(+)
MGPVQRALCVAGKPDEAFGSDDRVEDSELVLLVAAVKFAVQELGKGPAVNGHVVDPVLPVSIVTILSAMWGTSWKDLSAFLTGMKEMRS